MPAGQRRLIFTGNVNTNLFNKYTAGATVGGLNASVRRALKRRAVSAAGTMNAQGQFFPGKACCSAEIENVPIDTVPIDNDSTRQVEPEPEPQAPTDINLNNESIDENAAIGYTIGEFTTSSDDNDTGSFTYELIDGTGTDKVTIDGNKLQSAVLFNYEAISSFDITVKSTNDSGLSVSKSFTITVNDINEPPTNLTLSQNSVDEDVAIGTEIGTFTTTDPDNSNTFTYTFTQDSDTFEIEGDKLKTKAFLDYETTQNYTIKVNSNDGANDISRDFTIYVNEPEQFTVTFNLSVTNSQGTADSGGPIFLELYDISKTTPIDIFGNDSITDNKLKLNNGLPFKQDSNYSDTFSIQNNLSEFYVKLSSGTADGLNFDNVTINYNDNTYSFTTVDNDNFGTEENNYTGTDNTVGWLDTPPSAAGPKNRWYIVTGYTNTDALLVSMPFSQTQDLTNYGSLQDDITITLYNDPNAMSYQYISFDENGVRMNNANWRTHNKITLDFNSLSNININSSTSTTTYFRYYINNYNSQWPGDNIFTWYIDGSIGKYLKQSTTTEYQATQQSDNLYIGGVPSINPLDTSIGKWINLMLVRDGLTEYIYSDTNSTVGNMKLLYTIDNASLNLNKIYLGAANTGAADVTVSNLMVFNTALNADDVQSWVTYVNNGYT